MAVTGKDSKNAFLVLGPAGAGHSTALDIFSDFGFMAMAGVPPEQLPALLENIWETHAQLAFSVMVPPSWAGQPEALSCFAQTLADLKARHPGLKVLYLDSPQPALVQRYLDSGKKHGFESLAPGLEQAVATEKHLLGDVLKKWKDYAIDTSTHSPGELRNKIAKILGLDPGSQEMTVYITSFGFKYGIPVDAELLFDMRFITNPFYDETLRPMTGLDQPVKDYIFAQPHAGEFLKQWTGLLGLMLPRFQQEGKSRVSVAVGCTGGKHRSVCMSEALADYLRTHYASYNVVIKHRENFRWGVSPATPKDGDGGQKIVSATLVGGEER